MFEWTYINAVGNQGGRIMNTPVRNDEAVYRTVAQMSKETNICRKKLIKLAERANALIRIDRMLRIRADKFYEYFDNQPENKKK